jgi:glutamine amidotransferase
MANPPEAIIVDYHLGNLYNVVRACEFTGIPARITSIPSDVAAAAAVILPGVGAFGDAMECLRDSGMAEALRLFAASGRPLFAICLGMQLLMTESDEFGRHQGLDIVGGSVVRLGSATGFKVPQVGWNRIHKPPTKNGDAWQGTLLDGLNDGEYMYFVHSYYVAPNDPSVVLATTQYGETEFCSSLRTGKILGCQFHPERSGPRGLRMYLRLAEYLKAAGQEQTVAEEYLPHRKTFRSGTAFRAKSSFAVSASFLTSVLTRLSNTLTPAKARR